MLHHMCMSMLKGSRYQVLVAVPQNRLSRSPQVIPFSCHERIYSATPSLCSKTRAVAAAPPGSHLWKSSLAQLPTRKEAIGYSRQAPVGLSGTGFFVWVQWLLTLCIFSFETDS